ncbi:MAG: hypothetical protein AAF297_01425 [Planctomycetota bacterium]
MPSDLDRMIKIAKRLEGTLERDLGASGKGLHEKASSIEHKLDPQLVKDLRAVATVRNKLVHEEGFDKIDNRADVYARAKRAERGLSALTNTRNTPKLVKTGMFVSILAIAAAAATFVVMKVRGLF